MERMEDRGRRPAERGAGSWNNRGTYGHAPGYDEDRRSERVYGGNASGNLMRGPYRGRGPRGYERDDTRIRLEICERLTDHGRLDASGIEVGVSDSEVTLRGTVDSRESKRLADQLANTVTGVRDVHNRLRIEWDEEGQ